MKTKKYGIWLSNHTSRDDDEWVYVRAESAYDAKLKAVFDESRFSIQDVLPVAEFRKRYRIYGM